MKPGAEKLLTPGELKEKAKGWAAKAERSEDGIFFYKANRPSEGLDSIAELHDVSFIKEVIPALIKKKRNGEKVKILDVGAGAALFTDEIRKAFPNEVEVFSTGLRKSTAENYRREKNPNDYKLHPNDLKWRSVLELSDFEEFDLIVDSFGEFFYSVKRENEKITGEEIKERALKYLTAVIKKLKPEGIASIAMSLGVNLLSFEGQEIITYLEKEYPVKISLLQNGLGLRIEKFKSI